MASTRRDLGSGQPYLAVVGAKTLAGCSEIRGCIKLGRGEGFLGENEPFLGKIDFHRPVIPSNFRKGAAGLYGDYRFREIFFRYISQNELPESELETKKLKLGVFRVQILQEGRYWAEELERALETEWPGVHAEIYTFREWT